jgi:hypothetical protein
MLLCSPPFIKEDTVQWRISGICQTLPNRQETERVRQSMIRCVHACMGSGGGHLDHLLWIVT